MSAHFDGGAHIEGRRLREVEVMYVDDPSLNLDDEDSDDCPPSPPPTYYLRVREEKASRRSNGGGVNAGELRGDKENGAEDEATGDEGEGVDNSTATENAWAWRYVNVEKKSLMVWSRRGGQLLRSIPLHDVDSLTVIPDTKNLASVLEVHLASNVSGAACGDGGSGDVASGVPSAGDRRGSGGNEAGVLILQARSRRETFLWAKVLQENVELLTKRHVSLENLDEETSLGDVEQLAKLLTHQLSELQQSGDGDRVFNRSTGASTKRKPVLQGVHESIPEGAEDPTSDS